MHYRLDRDLSMQWIVLSTFSTTGAWPQFVQTLDSAIQRINHYPVNKAIVSRNMYRLDRDLSGGQHYQAFEQPLLGS